MSLSPGFVGILRALPGLFLPPGLVYGCLRILQHHGVWSTNSQTLKFLLSALALPLRLLISRIYGQIRRRREIAAFGATLPPRVQEGSIAITRKLRASLKDGYPGEIFLEWTKQYGEIYRFQVLGEERLFTTEPEHIKAILSTQFNDFVKGPVLYDQWNTLLGTGVFNSDGPMWKFHRTMTRPFFSRDRISDFDIFDRHCEDALGRIKARLGEGFPIEFQDVVARFTLDSATEFLFGEDVKSMAAGLPYPDPSLNPSSFRNHPSNTFVNAFLHGQELTANRARFGPYWRMLEFWKDEVKPIRRVLNRFVDPIISDALSKRPKSSAKETTAVDAKEGETFLQNLVQHTDSRPTLEAELINILVAGRDTTAGTLTFAVYTLTQHPDIAAKLRNEILSVVGPTKRPTYEDIKEMKYLRAFINEVLRLYPVVPFNARTCARGTTFPNKNGKPFYVAAGTKCLYGVFLMHRRKDLWGPDADVFDPERFIDERAAKYYTSNPFIFLPFNAGPRICLGQQFAYNETSFFLVRLLQTFSGFSLASDVQPADTKPPADWSKCEGSKGTDKIKFTLSLTMSVKGGMWMRMDSGTSA